MPESSTLASHLEILSSSSTSPFIDLFLCQGFCNCLTIVYVLDLCDSLKAKAICGVLLSLVGNAGTLITYTIGKDTFTQSFRLNTIQAITLENNSPFFSPFGYGKILELVGICNSLNNSEGMTIFGRNDNIWKE